MFVRQSTYNDLLARYNTLQSVVDDRNSTIAYCKNTLREVNNDLNSERAKNLNLRREIERLRDTIYRMTAPSVPSPAPEPKTTRCNIKPLGGRNNPGNGPYDRRGDSFIDDDFISNPYSNIIVQDSAPEPTPPAVTSPSYYSCPAPTPSYRSSDDNDYRSCRSDDDDCGRSSSSDGGGSSSSGGSDD